MKRYRVLINGENLLLNHDGELGKFGFRAIRMVKANDLDEAKRIALIQIHHELNQRPHILKDTPDVPRVTIEKIDVLKFFQFISKKTCSRLEFISEDQQQD